MSARLTVNACPLSIVIATDPGSPPDTTVFLPRRGSDGTAPFVTVADSKLGTASAAMYDSLTEKASPVFTTLKLVS